jgi:phage-related baseplate assembly protein
MSRFGLPEINFFEKAPEKILQEMLFHVNEATGQEFERADPRRKIIEGLAAFVAIERNRADYALKQTLLSYATDNALDHKGAEMDTARLGASAATTKFEFILDSERPVALTVPAGTRFSVGNIFFETEETQVVNVGLNTFVVDAVCTVPGTIGNGYLPGEITNLVDPLPYVIAVMNVTETAGGADVEDDNSYAERIRLAPERFSVAGPEGAYKYWALTASQDILDIEVTSPSPGTTHITILLKGGQLPTEEHIERVIEICSADDKRPLTDNLTAGAPDTVEYTPVVKYWINRANATVANIMQQEIENAFENYLVWQKSKLGRDINPTVLVANLRDKGAYKIVTEGIEYTELEKTQVAKEVNPIIQFMGLIDE